MAQAPASSSSGKSSGGASRGGSTSKASAGSKAVSSKAGKSDPVISNANHMPVLQARKGQAGEYATKGKWGSWADGQDAFKG